MVEENTEQNSEETLDNAEIAEHALKRYQEPIDPTTLDLREDLVMLKRVAKVVKGGRRFSFSALVVVGDGNGHVGIGFGKANEVPDAIQKGVEEGKKTLIRVPLVDTTIPFKVIGEYGAGRVMLKPASRGTGLIAGPAARSVLELAGVRDVFAKVLGSENQLNVVRAVFDGLKQLELAEEVCRRRGKSLDELLGRKAAARYQGDRASAVNRSAEVQQEVRREEKSRRGTYSAGGRKGEKPGT